MREQWQVARRQALRWETASEGEQRVAAQLLVLTERGWRLLVDRRRPGTRGADVDMLLVGPGGVFVIDLAGAHIDVLHRPPPPTSPRHQASAASNSVRCRWST
ncbi:MULTISPECIES: nuclease-related domain-containing protein [Streptomyces]|nr:MULTISPECIES: nuclease-related domain-containing protein [Streptomyces]